MPEKPLKLICFDVFDTLLTRKVTAPPSVFYFVGLQAIKDKLITCNAETYVNHRREAERLSRKEAGEGQIHINRIFDYLGDILCIGEVESKRLMDMEYEWEKKLLFEIPGAKALVEKYRNDAYQIIYVSDMYWAANHIKGFLSDKAIFNDNDLLFVSSEYGASKDSGNLFKRVFERFPNIRPEDIQHVGNDYHIDYLGAKKAGIQPVLVEKGNPNRYEILLEKHRNETNGLSSLISGSGRFFRLLYEHSDKKTSEIARLVGNVAGPSMLMYVLWIINQAKARQLKQLCFISRDGYVPYLICKQIGAALGFAGKIHYIYGSRQAWHIAGLKAFDDNTFNWLFEFYSTATVKDLFDRLDTTWGKAIEHFPDLKTILKQPDELISQNILAAFKAFTIKNTDFQNYILEIAEQKRQLLLDYFKDNQIDFSEKTGMIEIGWKGKTRISLENVLKEDQANNLHWLYLGLGQNIPQKDPARYSAFLYDPRQDYAAIDALPQIFESFCFAPHGSVTGFEKKDGKTTAIFNDKSEDLLDKWGRQIYLDMITSYCENLPVEIISSIEIPNMRHCAYQLLKAFCEAPDRADADILGDIPFIHDQGATKHSILAPRPKINLTTFKQGLLFGKHRNTANGSYSTAWGAGAWARRDKGMWPLYIFTFLGYLRINKFNEVKRILRETKHYLVKVFNPTE